ncbi:DnaJ C-terminal domain-containing protein [Glycomyces rhizosphaerae]|uniref:DnaJ C-terminal domain-containing protein n=1 Tax=Glycomyces rhizosphaerae TaxID=2054422 RepID=A0ABV7PRP4_9ACTN
MPGEPHSDGPIDLQLTLAELAFGGELTITVPSLGPCVNCEGSGRDEGDVCAYCRGAGTMMLDRDVTVTLPAGLADGETVTLDCEGIDGGVTAVVREREHQALTREGVDLRTVVEVEPEVLEEGDIVDVETLDGDIELQVVAGTDDGALILIRGKGMPVPGDAERRGDLIVELHALEPAAPEEIRAARSRGTGLVVAGAIAMLVGLLVTVTALVERMTFDVCESSGTTICAIAVDGAVQDGIDLTPEQQLDWATDEMVRDLVPGIVLLVLGFWLAAKGFRQMGEHRAEPGQVRAG